MCNAKLGRGTFTPFAQTPRQMWHRGTSSQLPSENSCKRGSNIGQSVLLEEVSTWVPMGTMHPKHLHWWAADLKRGSQTYSVHRRGFPREKFDCGGKGREEAACRDGVRQKLAVI